MISIQDTMDKFSRKHVRLSHTSQDGMTQCNIDLLTRNLPKGFESAPSRNVTLQIIENDIKTAVAHEHAIFMPIELVAIEQNDGGTWYYFKNKFEDTVANAPFATISYSIMKPTGQHEDTKVSYEINDLYLMISLQSVAQTNDSSKDANLTGRLQIGGGVDDHINTSVGQNANGGLDIAVGDQGRQSFHGSSDSQDRQRASNGDNESQGNTQRNEELQTS